MCYFIFYICGGIVSGKKLCERRSKLVPVDDSVCVEGVCWCMKYK
jgi:hypothetical protein